MTKIFGCGVLLIAALASAASVAEEAESAAGATRARSNGIMLNVWALRDRVVFCITADPDHKISAEYGVEFKVAKRDAKLWNESLPKTVTGTDWYFSLPLRIDLKTRAHVGGHRVHVDLGTCFRSDYCTPVKFDVKVPSYNGAEGSDVKCGD